MIRSHGHTSADSKPAAKRMAMAIREVCFIVSGCRAMATIALHARPWAVVLLIITEVVQGVAPVTTTWSTKLLIDRLAAGSGHSWTTYGPVVLLLVLSSVVGHLTAPVNQHVGADLGRRVSTAMQLKMYTKLTSFHGIRYFEDPKLHDVVELAGNRAQEGPLLLLRVGTSILRSTVTVGAFGAVLVAASPILVVATMAVSLPRIAMFLLFEQQRFGLLVRLTPAMRLAMYYSQVMSLARFAPELRLFRLGTHFLGGFRRLMQQSDMSHAAMLGRQLKLSSSVSVLSSVLIGSLLIIVAAQAVGNRLSAGDIVLYLGAVSGMQAAVSGVLQSVAQMGGSLMVFRHYDSLMSLPEPLTIRDRRPVQQLQRGIEFCQVSFKYRDDQPLVLQNVNLFIPAKTCVALVGLNGAGKSTMVKLLTRLYDPSAGTILWDGVDYRELDPAYLRSRITAVFQDFACYDLTARENIGVGLIEEVNNEHIVRRAAKTANIDDRLTRLHDGYDTYLSRWVGPEGGADLSGGEWQRVALARMFMSEADIMILDEPSGSLDARAEHDLHARLQRQMEGRTSILISHRFSTVRMADVIAVVSDGCVTEMGSHDDLMMRDGLYSELYSLQAARFR